MQRQMKTNDQLTAPAVVIICGPTGIGKTSSAIDMARRFAGEIVGADSMQIYRGMEIGTAKPTPEERVAVPHHMIDIVDPDEPFNAAMYADMAGSIVSALAKRDTIPFVVGGTGLYIKSLLHGLFEEAPVDPALRTRLKQEAAQDRNSLYRKLAAADPETAARVHPNDTYRIIRALETLASTGSTISQQQKKHRFQPVRFNALKICLDMDRKMIYDRINARVDSMIENGLLAEVQGLLDRGFRPHLKSMQSIGYRHMTDYLHGNAGWEETVNLLKRDTRRYAKRQLTWFRADAEMVFLHPRDTGNIQHRIDAFLNAASERI